jgi:hypothetical protein
MGDMRNACGLSVGNSEEKRHLENLDNSRRIILKLLVYVRLLIGFTWLRIGTSSGLL